MKMALIAEAGVMEQVEQHEKFPWTQPVILWSIQSNPWNEKLISYWG